MKLREFRRYRELLYVLTLREVQIRYQQSVLGIAWAVLQPLALMLISPLCSQRCSKSQAKAFLTPSLLIAPSLFWTFFSGSLSRAIPSPETNADLIKKIYFPREFFPMSSVLAAVFHLLTAAVIFLAKVESKHTFVVAGGSQEHLGEAALLVDPKDEKQIADAIKRLHDEPALRDTLVSRGMARASNGQLKILSRAFRRCSMSLHP